MSGALVIGGDYQGLGIVRSLGRRGIPVWVLDDKRSIAAVSRYTRRTLAWPTDERRQRDYLLALGKRHHLDGWVVYPTRDETVGMLAREHAALAERYRLATPPWEITRWAYDKRLTHELAAEAGVDAPWTRYPTSRDEVAALDCAFPVIIKPAIKEHFYQHTHAKAWRVDDRAALLARYDEACALLAPDERDEIMVQELIPGGGEAQFSFAALCHDGAVLASLAARRWRQHPMDFGHSSTYVETVEQLEVEAAGTALLRAMRYSGLAEVEFKRDPRNGRYKVLDVNARTWAGTLSGGGRAWISHACSGGYCTARQCRRCAAGRACAGCACSPTCRRRCWRCGAGGSRRAPTCARWPAAPSFRCSAQTTRCPRSRRWRSCPISGASADFEPRQRQS